VPPIQYFKLAPLSFAMQFTPDRTEHEHEPCAAGTLPDVLDFLDRLRSVRCRFLHSHLAQIPMAAIPGRGGGILVAVRVFERRLYQAFLREPDHHHFLCDMYRNLFDPRDDQRLRIFSLFAPATPRVTITKLP
jgi:hypothetical protein